MHNERDVLKEGYQLHHFGIVYYPGKPYLIGVMTRGGSKEVKEQVVENLSRITYMAVHRQLTESGSDIQIEPH